MNQRLVDEDPMAAELRARIESKTESLSVVREVDGGFVVGQLAPAALPVADIHRIRKPSAPTPMNRRARRAQAARDRHE